MPLTSGTCLGPYEIIAPLGAGGMGEVYKARDTKLGRDVAIKILPELFLTDPERVARFQREAQALAALNHPHIAGIYGLEESGATKFLALEFVDGESLAEKLARSRALDHQPSAISHQRSTLTPARLSVSEALTIARQIVDALEAAHEKGIVHRDLKPANIMLTTEGLVKVLDFGLAKFDQAAGTGGAERAGAAGDLTHSPTLTFAATQAGVILGTAAYMSPEQAKGRVADKRSDVWGFGCVLYEMLAGQRAFDGDDATEVIAAVVRGEPDWNALPAAVPPAIVSLIKRCLDKDRRKRIPDISVVRFLMDDAPADGGARGLQPSTEGSRRVGTRVLLTGAGGIALAVATGFGVWIATRPAPQTPRRVTRYSIPLARGSTLFTFGGASLAIAPDSSRIAYVGIGDSGTRQLYTQSLDALDPVPLRGSEGGTSDPVFSPDGQWIGFAMLSALRKVPVGGGAAVTIADVQQQQFRGASWLSDNTIVIGTGTRDGLVRVSAAGGTPTPITRIDGKMGLSHRYPDALPGGKAVLFTIQRSADFDAAAIGVVRLDTGETRVVLEGGMYGRYLPSGHLIFARARTLMAVPFDLKTLTVKGTPMPLVDGVGMSAAVGSAQFAVSANGTLTYTTGTESEGGRNLVWLDRRGTVQPIATPPQNFEHPRISPDGQRLAVVVRNNIADIWLYDFARSTLSRLTTSPVESETPVWTPDGARVTYAVGLESTPPRALVSKAVDGTGGDDTLATTDHHLHAKAWSPRGDVLVANDAAALGRSPDLWAVFMNEKRALRPLTTTPFAEVAAALSPDGRWLAYASNETGRFEVYAQAFPGPGGKVQISADGGAEPVWARNGRELFYRMGDKMMAVSVDGQGTSLRLGNPALLFQGRFAVSPAGDQWYDVSGDGRFLMLKPRETPQSSASLVVVTDWTTEVSAKSR